MSWREQVDWWWWWCPICTRPTRLVGYFIVPAHWNNGLRIDLSSSQTHYPDSEQISLSSFSLVICAWRRTIKCQFNSLWFQRSGLEPKIYRTRGKHAIHCILKRFGSTDVSINDIIHQKASSIKITEIDWVTNICICYFIWKVAKFWSKYRI